LAEWMENLRANPVPMLISAEDEALEYFVKRDLLCEEVPRIEYAWALLDVQKLKRNQKPNGSWSSGMNPLYKNHPIDLPETFKRFRLLVRQYGSTRYDQSTAKAAEYLFSCQSDEGDFRGFIGNQYATYYTGEVTALLTLGGYEDDTRIERAFKWLLSMRQNDGGWAIPMLTHELDRKTSYRIVTEFVEPLKTIRSRHFSHFCTDMVLRAFAVHTKYRRSPIAQRVGNMLKTRFFKSDSYSSYQDPKYWTRFEFWWPNLLTTLDSLSLLGFSPNDTDIRFGLDWFVKNQQSDGLWKVDYGDAKPHMDNKLSLNRSLWLTLNICRVFKRFYGITVAGTS